MLHNKEKAKSRPLLTKTRHHESSRRLLVCAGSVFALRHPWDTECLLISVEIKDFFEASPITRCTITSHNGDNVLLVADRPPYVRGGDTTEAVISAVQMMRGWAYMYPSRGNPVIFRL